MELVVCPGLCTPIKCNNNNNNNGSLNLLSLTVVRWTYLFKQSWRLNYLYMYTSQSLHWHTQQCSISSSPQYLCHVHVQPSHCYHIWSLYTYNWSATDNDYSMSWLLTLREKIFFSNSANFQDKNVQYKWNVRKSRFGYTLRTSERGLKLLTRGQI